MRLVSIVFWLGALIVASAHAAEPRGKALFEKHCAECHAPGPGHPGTQRLGWNRGERAAVLERRKDLSAEYVRAIVRRGLFEMPPFRPTELSESELVEIGAYLARGGK
jgi:(+)-pinoresinol hydroxylase